MSESIPLCNAAELVDHPAFNLVGKFLQVDIEFGRFTFGVTEYVNAKPGQFLGQFNVYSFLSDCQ